MGAAARDALASFASPRNRPTESIKNEIADLEDAMSEFQKKRDDLLAKRDRAPAGNFMNNFFGTTKDTIDTEVKDLDDKLERYGDVLAKRRGLLQSRLDGADSPPKTPTSAFEPRPDLGKQKDTAFDRQIDQINKRIAAYQAETDTVGMNVEAKAQARAEERGMWAGTFETPREWRRRNPRDEDERTVTGLELPRQWLNQMARAAWRWLLSLIGQ